MTLSGKSDFEERRERARAARQERGDASRSKHPWLFPLLVGIAIAAVVAAVVIATVTGQI